ncbi:MAG: hypothetical protein IT174_16325 [Acidobacteria bacterium]|nr:hypothetical protein [Acidobacteriota bacterium]
MDSLLTDKKKEPKGINYGLVIGVAVGILLIGAAALLIALQPPAEDQRAKMLEGAFTESSPEFAAISKDIIIATDDRTIESPNALGTISMFIVGSIRNKGPKTITAMEVNVSVVDLQNNVVKEKRILPVPVQFQQLGPNETISPVTVSLEGFDPKAERANIRWKVTAVKVAP